MVNKRLRMILGTALVVSFICMLNPTGVHAEWKKDSNGWWYSEGSSYAQGWKKIGYSWYYFNSDGYMERDKVIDNCVLGFDGIWKENVTLLNKKGSELIKGYWGSVRASAPNISEANLSRYSFENYKIIEDGESYCVVEGNYVINGVTHSEKKRIEFYKANNIPNEPIYMDVYFYKEESGEYNYNYESYFKYKDEYALASWICSMLPNDMTKYEEVYEKYADAFYERNQKDVAIDFLNKACKKAEQHNYDSSNLKNKILELQNK